MTPQTELKILEHSLVATAVALGKKGTKILEDLWPIYGKSLYREENYERFTDYIKDSPLVKAYSEAGCLPYFWDMINVVNVVFHYVHIRQYDTICPVSHEDVGRLVTDDGEVITPEFLIAQPKILGKLINIVPKLRSEKTSFAERDSYVLATLGIVREALTEKVDELLEDEEGEPTEEAEAEYGLIPMLTRINEDGTYTSRFDQITVAQLGQIRRALRDLIEETIE